MGNLKTIVTMYKRFIVFLLFAVLSFKSVAQRITELPPFHLLTTNSNYISLADLKNDKKIIIIYFSPDCSHCQLYTKELLKHMDVLSKTRILMITWVKLDMIQTFYNDFGLGKYPSFTVATEGDTYELFRLFNVKTTPYTAVYDKSHRLLKTFEKSPVIDSLLYLIKK
jgi:thioredoxin-related protein